MLTIAGWLAEIYITHTLMTRSIRFLREGTAGGVNAAALECNAGAKGRY